VGRKMHSMSSQEISNSIWSFAKFAYHPGPVMAQYQVEVARRVDQFDGQSLTTTMWAMAALSVRGRPLPPGRPRGLHRHACAAGCQPGLPGP
jgi:hypothetical protein